MELAQLKNNKESENITHKRDDLKKPEHASICITTPEGQLLSLEYKTLNDSHNQRGRQFVNVMSIFFSGSFIAFIFLLEIIKKEDYTPLLKSVVLIFAIGGIILACIYFRTTREIDRIYWNRIETIEDLLGIKHVHNSIFQDLQGKWWYCIRRYVWYFAFGFVILLYLILFLFI